MTMQEQFILDYAPYIDKWGLVQPQPGTTSDNGLRFTCEALLAAKSVIGNGDTELCMQVWINDRLTAIESCQRIPGVLQRYPGCNTQEGFDDYFAVACIGKLFNRPIALNMYLHGLDNAGIYRSTPSSTLWTLNNNPFLWRNPGLQTHMKHCAGEGLNCINLKILEHAINASAKSTEQDHKILTWFIIRALNGRYKQLEAATNRWSLNLISHYGSVGHVLGEYFHPEHHNHPSAKYLKFEVGNTR